MSSTSVDFRSTCKYIEWWPISATLIAKALIIEPQILILDEATTNLDIINEETILNMLKELTQIQMIIISHDPYVIDYFKGQRLDLDL